MINHTVHFLSLFGEALAEPQFKPGRFSAREKTTLKASPSVRPVFTPEQPDQIPSAAPTLEVFGADTRTGQIQDSHTAFKEFQRRMSETAHSYQGEKRDNFLK